MIAASNKAFHTKIARLDQIIIERFLLHTAFFLFNCRLYCRLGCAAAVSAAAASAAAAAAAAL
jgi:hypothetical protein